MQRVESPAGQIVLFEFLIENLVIGFSSDAVIGPEEGNFEEAGPGHPILPEVCLKLS